MVKLAIVVLCLVFNTIALASELSPFVANYKLLRGGDELGKGQRILEKLDDQNYRLSYNMKGSWFIFKDDRRETVEFTIKDKKVAPYRYEFIRTGTGSDKHYHLKIDQDAKRAYDVINDMQTSVRWDDVILDHLGYQMQLKIDVDPEVAQYNYLTVSQKGKEKRYEFTYEGTEKLTLEIGEVEAYKVKRVSGKRVTYAWMSTEHDNLLVRLQQFKKGVEQFDVLITSYEYK